MEALAAELAPVLERDGSVVVATAGVEDLDRWRRAARRAGRRIGHRVRTGVARDGSTVWVVSEEYRTPPGELRIGFLRMNTMIDLRPKPGRTKGMARRGRARTP
ncbi:MAG: hypothetical protein H0U89_02075 [Acidimicrobiia bacterium]|nr:hypothetical protein [Acidimicrobiia bacterium]